MQPRRLFFDPDNTGRFPTLPPRPSDQAIRTFLSPNNSRCPLNNIVCGEENRGNMRAIRRLAYSALSDPNHRCRGLGFGIYASPGQGKTHLVRQFVKTLGLPSLMTEGTVIDDAEHLFSLISDTLEAYGTPLVETQPGHFQLPPVVVFIDEAHKLSKSLRTAALLPAMEAGDGWLTFRSSGRGGIDHRIDCREVCWIVASTDPGILYQQSQAFYTRFPLHLEWQNAGEAEIAEILRRDNLAKHESDPDRYPLLCEKTCQTIAAVQTIPREALAFADQVILESRMSGCEPVDAVSTIAKDVGVDEDGLPVAIFDILKILADGSISDKRIIHRIGCRREQFDGQYAPKLLADFQGRGPLATMGRGWSIAPAGRDLLIRRGVSTSQTTTVK